jgi:hypothetical protein
MSNRGSTIFALLVFLSVGFLSLPTKAEAAVSRTGSVTNITRAGNTGTSNIAVPADAEILVVGVGGWRSGEDNYFSGGTLKVAGNTMLVAGDGDLSYAHMGMLYYYDVRSLAGTSVALANDWSGANNPNVGVNLTYAFYKGVDTANPVRATGAQQDVDGTLTTASLSASSGDMVVAALAYTDNVSSITWTNATQALNSNPGNGSQISVAEGSPSGNTTPSVAINNGDLDGALLAVVLASAPAVAGSSYLQGFAWSETIGWICFYNATDCPLSDVPLTIVNGTTATLSGYAWSENIGWINFGANSCGTTPSIVSGALQGWAQVVATDVGWDGCIKLSDSSPAYGPTIAGGANVSGDLNGYAWGSDVVGWISFNCLTGSAAGGSVCAASNYKVSAVINPPPTVTISASDPTAYESPLKSGKFTLTRTGSTAAQLTVTISTAGSTAAASDYTANPSGTSISIPIGSATKDIIITPTIDGVPEGAESVKYTVTAGPYTLGAQTIATVIITDVPPGIITDGAIGEGLKAVCVTGATPVHSCRIRKGGTAYFTWQTTAMTNGCTFKNPQGTLLSSATNNTSFAVPNITAESTFRLTCTDGNNITTVATATILIIPVFEEI